MTQAELDIFLVVAGEVYTKFNELSANLKPPLIKSPLVENKNIAHMMVLETLMRKNPSDPYDFDRIGNDD
jgi:hypothetical protein